MCNSSLKITVLTENDCREGLKAEHGLSLLIEYKGSKLIFDFGMSSLFIENAERLGLDLSLIKHAFLSHGHNDHTGGLQYFHGGILFCTPDIDRNHFSLHPGKPPKSLTMPDESRKVLHDSETHYVHNPEEILPGILCTGKIPRHSTEDCGGPFFTAPDGMDADNIDDESALLFDNGILLHGCCHSGIINTLEHCHKVFPQIKIHTIIGGLHLLHSQEKRLAETTDYLAKHNIKGLYLMHCTGANAIEYLRSHLNNCKIHTPHAGDIIIFD